MVSLHQDTDRIRRFVDEGSQDAFAEMVEAHSGLVYHTALRGTRDPHLAEDVTQSVFALLARRAAKLRKNGSLAGWLHRTACLQAANARRCEDRHHARMRAFAKHVDSTKQVTEEIGSIGDDLDEALTKLSERDRKIIFLKFYQDQNSSEIGQAMGKSEDAARKHVSRALGRLANLLHRHGHVTTAVSLATVLTSQMAKAAPSTLTSSLAKKSLSTAPTLSHTELLANAVLTMNTTKNVVAITLIACLPLSWQQWTLSKEQTTLASLRASDTESRLSLSSSPTSILAQASRGRVDLHTAQIDAKALAEAIREAQEDGDFILMAENEQKLSHLAKEGAPRLTTLIDEAFSLTDIDDKSRRALVNQLFERLIPIDAAGAANLAWKHLPGSGGDHRHHRHLSQALNSWASTAPVKALNWYQSTLGREDFELPSLNGAEEVRNIAVAGLVSGLFTSDEALATVTYQTLSRKQQTLTLTQFGKDTASTPEHLSIFIDLVSKHPPQRGKRQAIESLLRSEQSRETAVNVIEHTNVDAPTKVILYGFAAVPKGMFTAQAFQESLAWAEKQAPAGYEEATVIEGLVTAFTQRQDKVPTILKEWERLSGTFADTDAALERILTTWPLQNAYHEQGLRLASRIQDRVKRLSIGKSLIRHGLNQSDPTAALSTAGFGAEDIQAILGDSLSQKHEQTEETFEVPVEVIRY